MPLTLADVQRIAELSRLELDAAARGRMLDQLNDFFAIVEKMRAVDTSGVEPLYTPLAAIAETHLRLRDDAATEVIDRAANQASAPLAEGGLYLVPRVVE